MSRASGASESSIDWFWQTMQRSSADSARARLQRGIGQHFVGLHGMGERGGDGQGEDEGEPRAASSLQRAAATGGAAVRAGAGAPMRRRRSASDRAPPSAIRQAPSQIRVTSGFQ